MKEARAIISQLYKIPEEQIHIMAQLYAITHIPHVPRM